VNLSNAIDTILADFAALTHAELFMSILNGASLIVLILVLFKAMQVIVGKVLKGRLADQNALLVRKLIRYTGFTVAALTIFNRLGIDVSALLGAAGIAGIAVGFAAQTSVSNVISGLFLISEKPFLVGDSIQVADVSGIVQSIDFLSVKIQTFDNRFIRVPNETIIKSNVVNVTRYPIRRLDVWLSISYREDLERVKRILEEIARDNVYVLDNPEPLILIDKFDASGISILFGPWFEKSSYLSLKNSIMIDVVKRFNLEGITIPLPQLDVHVSDQGAVR
jgi:small-conductance mechanosensitive channel